MSASIREDLVLGTAYGLAVSALVWTLFFAPPPLGATGPLLIAGAAALGACQLRIPGLGRTTATYPATLVALIHGGPGLSSLAALACRMTARLTGRVGDRPLVRGIADDATRALLASCVAGVAFVAVGGRPEATGPFPTAMAPLLVHAATFAIVDRGLAALARRMDRAATPDRRFDPRPWVLLPLFYGATLFASHVAAWLFADTATRPLVLTVTLLAATTGLVAMRREQERDFDRQRASSLGLYRSVTEALARTMEAKDQDTQSHLRRVQSMCVGIGKRLELTRLQIEALSSAALLHDIGKVAVPEGILSKPGRLTSDEMERVKKHPAVGADILQAIPFPYPLAPIVRHHHERWDGSGYPAGLKGESIPIGARVLAVADTYDALTTDRPYRKAVNHGEAVSFLRREAGTMFDPVVVDELLNHLATDTSLVAPIPVPASEDPNSETESRGAAGGLPLSQQELRSMYDLTRAQGYGMNLDEYLTIASCKLAELVPYKSLVVYSLEPDERMLRAVFALGRAANKLRLMTIPLGDRLSGFAALQGRAVIGRDHETLLDRDGSRSDLEEWGDDPEVAPLNSTMVAPMVADGKILGVVTLYDHADRGFTAEDRRVLVRVAGVVAEFVQHAGVTSHNTPPMLTDPMTGVPNARFLWLETAHRIAAHCPGVSGFGLLAFRLLGVEQVSERMGNESANRLVCRIARRFAASCDEHETLVRFGQDLFLVLTASDRPGDLVRRWNELAAEIESPPLATPEGVVQPVRLAAAHASFPDDGDSLDTLLAALDQRLGESAGSSRTVVPFRRPTAPASATS